MMYFDIVLSGEQGNKQFVITKDQYDRWAEQCIKEEDNNKTSAVKELTVTSLGDSYDVQLNFVSGSFEYRHYVVNRNGTIERLAEEALGHCGFAI